MGRYLLVAAAGFVLMLEASIAGAQQTGGTVTVFRGDQSPDGEQDGYTWSLAEITRRHMSLLPRSIFDERHGKTIVDIWVKPNGKIIKTEIKETSGYPDIDERIAQIVKSMGQFPPLPVRFKNRDSVTLELSFKFPEALTWRQFVSPR